MKDLRGRTILTASYGGIISPYCKVFVWEKTKKNYEGYTNTDIWRKQDLDGQGTNVTKKTGVTIIG